MVPAGRWDVAALAAAVHERHPDWQLGAVWCGDPQLRPRAAASVPWIDLRLDEPIGAGWGRLIVAMSERAYEWSRTAAALDRWFGADDAPSAVAVVRVGSVAVEDGLHGLVPDAGVRLVRRTRGIPPADGFGPTMHDLAGAGPWSVAAVGVHADARPHLRALGEALFGARSDDSVGAALNGLADDAAGAAGAGSSEADASVVHCLGWGDPPTDRVGAVDVDALDHEQPWRIRISDAPSRVRLSRHPDFTSRLDRMRPQFSGERRALTLPGGLAVDAPMRTLLADALDAWRRGDGELPPAPFGADPGGFLSWLETPSPAWGAPVGRYWREVRSRRGDLSAAFPRADSVDQYRFREWVERTWWIDGRSPLLRAATPATARPVIDSTALNRNGVNVVGYLGFDSSLGDVARRIVQSLEAAHVPVAPIGYDRTASPATTLDVALSDRAPYATNLVVVNADQFHFLVADHGDTLLRGRRTIAYWFWELDVIPPHMVEAIDHVDEVWAGTRFVADAFAKVTSKPVRLVPVPVPEPTASSATRRDLGMPDDAFVFLATFDHFSVIERKNPFGTVEAFCRAFPEPTDGGPVLVVKTINGEGRWDSHERLLLATSHRPDIVVIDAHLDRADQMAMLRHSDCLVSLHRSEGLGLHCAEAMWFARPVVATRYSGNLDFMDDDCSALVDATLVPVEHGEGVYPVSARWADPDLDQAAAWMRRLVAEPATAARLGAAARRRMQSQPTPADTGRLVARAGELGAYRAGDTGLVRPARHTDATHTDGRPPVSTPTGSQEIEETTWVP